MSTKLFSSPAVYGAFIGMLLIKVLFFFTHHIQEDAFITWRVAKNILDYGVIGYNGEEVISSSTTHLYVFVSLAFQWFFGIENFIYPLLTFNAICFGLGSLLLLRVFLRDQSQFIFAFILLNFLPPAIKASVIGMEYGLVFLFYGLFVYFAWYKENRLAQLFLPVLLLWLRLDMAVFLGLIFIVMSVYQKKIVWPMVLGGLIGLSSVLAFNYLYFGEWINHTIQAKRIAYGHLILHPNWQRFNAFFYIGMIKFRDARIAIPSSFFLLTSLFTLFKLLREEGARMQKYILVGLTLFAWVKWLLYISQSANFDWYYWVPQLFVFLPILLFSVKSASKLVRVILLFCVGIFFSYQVIHSVTTGNGEHYHREKIGKYLDGIEADKSQWILLEPAGYIPYFSGLKVMDEVGLVDKRVLVEMIQSPENWYWELIRKYKPKYILPGDPIHLGGKNGRVDLLEFNRQYELKKYFKAEDVIYSSSNKYLQKLYRIKPSARDYYLYQRIEN